MAYKAVAFVQVFQYGIFTIRMRLVIPAGDIGAGNRKSPSFQHIHIRCGTLGRLVAVFRGVGTSDKVACTEFRAMYAGDKVRIPPSVALEHEAAVRKESHVRPPASYAAVLFLDKENAFHHLEILQAFQADPDAVLVIGTDTRHTLVAMVVTYHHGIRHHVCPVSACPVAVHLVHMRHDARISLCPALYGIKIALPVLPAGNAHTLQLRLEVTEHSFFFPRRGSYIIECNQSFHKIKYLNVTHQTQAYTLADIRLRQPL